MRASTRPASGKSRRARQAEDRIATSSTRNLKQRAEERAQELAASLTKLEETERRFRLLVEGVTDYAIYMLDPDGHVINWNPGASGSRATRAHEIIGQHFSRSTRRKIEQADVPHKALRRRRETGKYEAEGWRVRKDGTPVLGQRRHQRDPGQQGELLGFAKVTRDLTERRAAEERAAPVAEDGRRSASSQAASPTISTIC